MGVPAILNVNIREAAVSLIHPLVIPGLFLKSDELASGFEFLRSATDYSQYYLDLERPSGRKEKFPQPVEIPDLGALPPLQRRHTMNSFWRCIRLRIKIEKEQGANPDDLFLFLPLELDLPIEPIRANNKDFDSSLKIYLFPFGACVANLDVKMNDLPINEFVDCARKLSGSTIKGVFAQDAVPFKRTSKRIANMMTGTLLGGGQAFPFSLHTMLFVQESAPELTYASHPHKKAIKAAMIGKRIEDVAPETNEAVTEYFEPKVEEEKKRRVAFKPTGKLGEILLFNPRASFFYKSPSWQSKKGPICMKNNFNSFLIFLFALNRSLTTLLRLDKASLPQGRRRELKRALHLAFPDSTPHLYYKQACLDVATSIGLNDSLKDVQTQW